MTQRQPGVLMAQLLNRFMWFDGALQKSLDARGYGGVRRLESMTMVYVHAGIRRPSELARLLGVTRQSMNTALRELEEKRLVYMAPDPEDARCKLVTFAPEGAGVRAEALEIVSGLEAELEARLGAKTVENLARIVSAEWGEAPVVTKPKREGKKKA
ncbi:MarR family winged helix-turn-helix transcriptional regulator [Parvibaculum sp.]|uniref:MarR family winged helix-turn-helix transcriptional regulator n=1 Tax=Parvibaculum sp. TaxID=2024848 RepID=UPI0027318FCC|nr:MarR family transcriptional regulator [Parvibaculum sp.]MDP1626366.1 MarR family transcriptional regulator [Parvibaculum sp.]MDP2151243.1 MarR family transcriptional regulator [Parvibaculum sp.]MDP3330248.1 MarR family transcriptional regulator [Parvibaculum sp.]